MSVENELKAIPSAKLKKFVTVKSKKTSEGVEIKFTSLEPGTDASISMRRIDNGYTVRVTEWGKNGGMKETEYFSEESPVITLK